jgi:hypothetical protein
MKTICFLVTIINGVLLNGAPYAVASSPASAQTTSQSAPSAARARADNPGGEGSPRSDAGESRGRQSPRHSEKGRPRSKAPAEKPIRPRPQSVAQQQTLPQVGNLVSARPSTLAQPAGVNRGSIQNEAIYRALPVRPGGMVRPAVPSAGNLRHRDPNPAVIGGTASSKSRNTAAIDGTRINLKASRN